MSMAWFTYYDNVRAKEFEDKKMGKVVWMTDDTVKKLRTYSMEVVDEYSKKDPKYCAPAAKLLKDLLQMSGRLNP